MCPPAWKLVRSFTLPMTKQPSRIFFLKHPVDHTFNSLYEANERTTIGRSCFLVILFSVRHLAGAGGAARIPSTPCAPGHLLIHGVYPKQQRLGSPRGGRRLAPVFRDSQPPAARRPYSIAWVIAASSPLHLWTDHERAIQNNQSLFICPWQSRVAPLLIHGVHPERNASDHRGQSSQFSGTRQMAVNTS